MQNLARTLQADFGRLTWRGGTQPGVDSGAAGDPRFLLVARLRGFVKRVSGRNSAGCWRHVGP